MTKAAAAQIVGGFLNVNKDAGMTSMDVVRQIKRITGQKKVGHAGTLDPDATGVLPVALGKATKFVDFVMQGRKRYSMTVHLGEATDTYDASGRVTESSDPSSIDQPSVEKILPEFTGTIDQVPPMYSALKRNGKPLYKLAREGIVVEREARRMTVHDLRLTRWNHPEFDLEVECGKGFYARSLAHDLGIALGSHAHLRRLERTTVGPFAISDAHRISDLEEMGTDWISSLDPLDTVLQHLPAVSLNPLAEQQIRNGQSVRATPAEVQTAGAQPGSQVRLYDSQGQLIATAIYDPVGPWWKPDKVIVAA